jgi:MFS family permease
MVQAMEPPDCPPRTPLELVSSRDFGIVFWGKIVVLTGVWAQTITVLILTYQMTGSSAWVGVVSSAQLGPQLALSLASGRLTDRRGPISQIVAGALVFGSACTGLGLWLAIDSRPNQTAAILAFVGTSLICGIGTALFAPAFQSIVPMLVRRAELSTALGLNFAPTALARTIGPATGALLASSLGAPATLGAIGLVTLTLSVPFLLVHCPAVSRQDREGDLRISAALRYVWATPQLLVPLLAVAAIAAGSEPAITLAPSIAQALKGHGASAGWITSCFGLGGLLGVAAHQPVRRRVSPNTEGVAGMAVLAFTMAASCFSHSLWVVSPLFVAAGASMLTASIGFSVAVQERSPAAMLGRIMALWGMAFAGIRPAASLVLGLASDSLSTTTAVVAACGLTLVAAACVYLTLGRPGAEELVARGRGAQGLAGTPVTPGAQPSRAQ